MSPLFRFRSIKYHLPRLKGNLCYLIGIDVLLKDALLGDLHFLYLFIGNNILELSESLFHFQVEWLGLLFFCCFAVIWLRNGERGIEEIITPKKNLFLKDAYPQTLPNPSRNSIYAIYFVISVSISFMLTYWERTKANSQNWSPQSLL